MALIHTVTCKVTFASMRKTRFTFELHESPCFDYGNHTAVRIVEDGCEPILLDTRYSNGLSTNMSASAFSEWCSAWLKENCNETVLMMGWTECVAYDKEEA